MTEADHVVIRIVGVLICIALFISDTHQAIQKIIGHPVRLSGRIIGCPVQISFAVIDIIVQKLFFLRCRTVIILFHQTALGIVLAAQVIPICILCLQQLSVVFLIFIRNDG